TAIVFPVAYVFRRTRKLKDERNDLHGSAHWAVAEEIEAAGILPTPANVGGVMLGAVDVPFKAVGFNPFGKKTKTVYLRHGGPEHILVFAPTRSGKGVGIVVPTLLSWSESVLVHDIKGENWALTSGFRERVLKQRCLRFSPSETDSARFNPLSEIRLDDNLVKDVQNVSTMIVDPDGKGLQDHWAKTGFDLMTGVIIFVLVSDELEDMQRNLSTVQAILSDGGPVRELAERLAADKDSESDEKTKIAEGFRAVMEYIRDTGYEKISAGHCIDVELVAWKTASQAAQSFLNKASNEASGVLSTALSFLSLYRDPIVAANTSASDFTIESLMQRWTSLYLVVPPSDKDRLKPLLRLVINQVVRRLTEKMEFDETGASKSRFPHKMLLLIDEFPALGKLEIFEEALAFIAGYGLKALLITQDLSQLTKAYSKDESILSNCHIRIAFAPNKIETAELLSKMSGAS
ncbi:MAG: conjugal transfer protein TraG, partial [Comamonadaceae bacterium CG_4_9_14_0_8_um_filter_57_21]